MISSYYLWKWADNDLPGKPNEVFSALIKGALHPALQTFNAIFPCWTCFMIFSFPIFF